MHSTYHHWTAKIVAEHQTHRPHGCIVLTSHHLPPGSAAPPDEVESFYFDRGEPPELDLSALDLDAVRLRLPPGYVLRRVSRGVEEAEQPAEPGEACRYCGQPTRQLESGYCPSCAATFKEAWA